MRTTTRELLSLAERRVAAETARSWGYPRAVSWFEVVHGRWWASPEGIGWMVTGHIEGTVTMHGAADLGHYRVVSPEIARQIVAAAREMGATRVYAPLASHDELRDALKLKDRSRAMRRLLVRAGWKEDALGAYLEVTHG